MPNIIILGDSSSMSVGLEKKTYPFQLTAEKIWAPNTTIINGSQPGFTSTGICAFYFNKVKELKNVQLAIIYIGNNDGVLTDRHQGKYSSWKHVYFQIRRYLPGMNSKKNTVRWLTQNEWNNHPNLELYSGESEQDYAFNLERILKDLKKQGIASIIIIPRANRSFPAGLGKGNFLFYRYLNLTNTTTDTLVIDDIRFKNALTKHEAKKFTQALTLYKQIIVQPNQNFFSKEYPLLLVNNYAVASAQLGRTEEAKYLWEILLRDKNARKEIIYFNLAELSKRTGDLKGANKLYDLAYEQDLTIFRIKQKYIKQLKYLATKYVDPLSIS